MKNATITTALIAATLAFTSFTAQALCVSVGDVKEVTNSGKYTTIFTHGGTFIVDQPIAIAQTWYTIHRHAAACYDSSRNTLTYTTPDRTKKTIKVQ